MSTNTTRDFLYKLFIDPGLRVWRHTLLMVAFILIAIGQSLGTDLTGCDFSEEEQRLEMFYKKEGGIGLKNIKKRLNFCLEKIIH